MFSGLHLNVYFMHLRRPLYISMLKCSFFLFPAGNCKIPSGPWLLSHGRSSINEYPYKFDRYYCYGFYLAKESSASYLYMYIFSFKHSGETTHLTRAKDIGFEAHPSNICFYLILFISPVKVQSQCKSNRMLILSKPGFSSFTAEAIQ